MVKIFMAKQRASITQIFAANLKRIRLEKGYTQEQLALMCGFDRTYITGLENAYRNPSLKAIDKISLTIDVAPAEFFRL